ncbi:MAG: long-chain-fatty-acid--CoA ligase [Chloroflexia bacterium]
METQDPKSKIQNPTSPWLAHYEPQVPQSPVIPNITLHELFEATVHSYPHNTATIFFGARLTYAQLDDHANRLAAGLQSLGVTRGERVGLLLPNCPQFIIALYAALKAGAVVVPANPLYTQRELRNQFNDSGVETVIALDTLAPRVMDDGRWTIDDGGKETGSTSPSSIVHRPSSAEGPVKRLVVTHTADYLSPLMASALAAKQAREGTPADLAGDNVYSFSALIQNSRPHYTRSTATPDDTALLLYTGGTTGVPKGAMLTHRNLVANTNQMKSWVWDATPENREVFLGVIPFFHSYGLTVVMNFAIAVAGAIVLVPRFVMKDVLRAIARFRPTIFPAVPTMYNAIAHHPLSAGYNLRSIRVCISGAAPLPMEVAHAFESVTGARLVEGYGLTETSPVTHCNPIYGERREGSIGLPIPLTESLVVDPDTRQPLPVGQVGELAIRAPQVMQGYWHQPEENAQTIRDGWFYTGDMARQDPNGYFYIVDRKKDLILVGGYNVYPREVEEVLYECDKVQEALVAGVPDRNLGEIVKAYVVLKPGVQATEPELRRFCAERLAPFKVPMRVEFRETLPKSGVGKYLRKQLIEEEQSRAQGSGISD